MKFEEIREKIHSYLNDKFNALDIYMLVDNILYAFCYVDDDKLKEYIIFNILNWLSKDYIEYNIKDIISNHIVKQIKKERGQK